MSGNTTLAAAPGRSRRAGGSSGTVLEDRAVSSFLYLRGCVKLSLVVKGSKRAIFTVNRHLHHLVNSNFSRQRNLRRGCREPRQLPGPSPRRLHQVLLLPEPGRGPRLDRQPDGLPAHHRLRHAAQDLQLHPVAAQVQRWAEPAGQAGRKGWQRRATHPRLRGF